MKTQHLLRVFCPVHPPSGPWRLVPDRLRPEPYKHGKYLLAMFAFGDFSGWPISHDAMRAAVDTFNSAPLATRRRHVCLPRSEIVITEIEDPDYGEDFAYKPVTRPVYTPYRFSENELNYLPRD